MKQALLEICREKKRTLIVVLVLLLLNIALYAVTASYLEPKIAGKGDELFTRFRKQSATKREMSDCPPHVTITSADGKQVLSKTMEYG